MSQGKSRGKASKGVVEFRPRVTRVLPVGAQILCFVHKHLLKNQDLVLEH